MQPRSTLFTIYGDFIRYRGGEAWVGTLTRLLAELGMGEPAVRAAISRMLRQGWLGARKVNGKSYYGLSERGLGRLEDAGRRIYQLRPNPWDGAWRIVSYAVPEERRALRDRLRQELSWLGFAPLASGVWLSPNALERQVQDLLDAEGLAPYVELFTAQHQGPSLPRELVARSWDLAAIDARYGAFVAELCPRLDTLRARPLPDNLAFVERVRLVHEYRKFLFIDPGLPAELLPDGWQGATAAALFHDTYTLLAPGADRFFDRVFRGPPDRPEAQRRGEPGHIRNPFLVETAGSVA